MGVRRGRGGARRPKRRRQKRSGRTYRSRDTLLRRMGYSSYPAYLRSPLWASIKARIPAPLCCIPRCGRPRVDLHHTTYEARVLAGDLPDDALQAAIVPLCSRCHRLVEFAPTGSKHTMQEALLAYTALRTAGVPTDDWEKFVDDAAEKRVPSNPA